jgi:DAK2 domain
VVSAVVRGYPNGWPEREPAAGPEREPAAGPEREPAAGPEREPAAGPGGTAPRAGPEERHRGRARRNGTAGGPGGTAPRAGPEERHRGRARGPARSRAYPAIMAALEFLDGAAVRRWCGLAAEALGAAREQIDALNVFPVADSDTGTNLHLTMLAGVQALDTLPVSAGQEAVWQALARGVLLGAQGNSGVIMSEYLRGLAEVCAPASPCGAAAVRRALAHAAHLSHAAVGEPVEGTVPVRARWRAARFRMPFRRLAARSRPALRRTCMPPDRTWRSSPTKAARPGTSS